MSVTAIALGGILLRASARGREQHKASGTAPAEGSHTSIARTVPLSIRPLVHGGLDLGLQERQWIRSRIQPPPNSKRTPLALYLHVLRVHGLNASFPRGEFGSSAAVLELFTDQARNRAYYGTPGMVRTRSGVRFLLAPEQPLDSRLSPESHRDQCLAAFGELGLPLSTPLRLEEEDLTLHEVLRDSIANFHLHQNEPQWTALAYALYLPPQREWVNRFGEKASFDQLTEELLRRPLHRASCAGAHNMYTLTVLARVDQEVPILNDDVRARLWDYLRRAVRTARDAQRVDGTWLLDWYRDLRTDPASPPLAAANPDSPRALLLVTGHLAEWLLYLPPDLQVPNEQLNKAGWWLYEQMRRAPEDIPDPAFCPYAHVACVLRQLTAEPFP